MITIKERNGLTINNPDEGEKTLFLDTDGKLKTKNENGIIEEVSIVSANTPKVYKALLTQAGTDAPVATVLENTLGGEVVWTRNDVGDYRGTLANAFPNNKTTLGNGYEGAGTLVQVDIARGNWVFLNRHEDGDFLQLRNHTDINKTDNQDNINSVPILIEVYP